MDSNILILSLYFNFGLTLMKGDKVVEGVKKGTDLLLLLQRFRVLNFCIFDTWSCLIRSLSSSPGLMRPRRAACPSLAPGKRSVSSPSRYSGRTRNSRYGSRYLPAGQRRSSSTRLITARVFLYRSKERLLYGILGNYQGRTAWHY